VHAGSAVGGPATEGRPWRPSKSCRSKVLSLPAQTGAIWMLPKLALRRSRPNVGYTNGGSGQPFAANCRSITVVAVGLATHRCQAAPNPCSRRCSCGHSSPRTPPRKVMERPFMHPPSQPLIWLVYLYQLRLCNLVFTCQRHLSFDGKSAACGILCNVPHPETPRQRVGIMVKPDFGTPCRQSWQRLLKRSKRKGFRLRRTRLSTRPNSTRYIYTSSSSLPAHLLTLGSWCLTSAAARPRSRSSLRYPTQR
jgi:hypothetical protein